MKRNPLRRALYQPYKWLVYIPFLGASTAFFGSLAITLPVVKDPDELSDILGPMWARTNSRMAPMKVEVRGRENIRPGQSYVICSNHLSHFDIFVLYGYLGLNFKWVMKEELKKVPFIGPGCQRLGHIFIDRSNREKALASINAAREKLKNGICVLFFPEGTRSTDGRMGPFKKGAFKLACNIGLPILPVTINGTFDILPTHTMDLMPGKATLTIHPPIPVEGLEDKDVPDLMDRVREVIASGLEPQPD